MNLLRLSLLSLMVLCSSLHLSAQTGSQDSYAQVNLVSDDPDFNPQIIDSNMEDAWGIAVRPAGAGGHFWVNNAYSGTTSEFIGDVNGIPLHQDALTNLPVNYSSFADTGHSIDTGLVYNAASDVPGQPVEFGLSNQASKNFTTGASVPGGFTGSAKFVFVTEDGDIDAWSSSTANAMPAAVPIIDYDKESTSNPYSSAAVFSGCAMTTNAYTTAAYTNEGGNHLFAVNFRATSNAIAVFNNQWQNVTANFSFQPPADVIATYGTLNPLHAFNIADIGGNLYVTYAGWSATGDEGQEQVNGEGLGRLVEYSETGQFIREFNDEGNLNAPWGVVQAPSGFGKFGGDILVANFVGGTNEIASASKYNGGGTIAAFDPRTGNFVGDLSDTNGNVISIDGLWGMTFGNGVSLGDSNSLYFTAGPNSEQNGLFGKLTYDPVVVPEPASNALFGLGALIIFLVFRRRHAIVGI